MQLEAFEYGAGTRNSSVRLLFHAKSIAHAFTTRLVIFWSLMSREFLLLPMQGIRPKPSTMWQLARNLCAWCRQAMSSLMISRPRMTKYVEREQCVLSCCPEEAPSRPSRRSSLGLSALPPWLLKSSSTLSKPRMSDLLLSKSYAKSAPKESV